MKSSRFIFCSLAVMALLAVSCGKDDPVDIPDDGNGEATLVENDKVKAAVASMAAEAATSSKNLTGIEVWQEGYLSSGAWLGGTAKGTRHPVWSVTKSFTGVAVGIAIGEGKLELTDKVAEIFPSEVAQAAGSMTGAGKANLDALTVEHLLMMADGHIKDPTVEYGKIYSLTLLPYIRKDGFNLGGALDKVGKSIPELFFSYPFEDAPGTRFCYDSFASCMLSEIIKRKTGEDLADYLYVRLFQPLGMEKPSWDKAQGVSIGGWGLHLTTHEMVLFGRLLLSGGEWDGQRIVPSDFLARGLKDRIDVSKNYGESYSTSGYGYQVWTRGDGSLYICMGLFGQYIVVLPEKKAVVALTTNFDLSLANLIGLLSDGSPTSNEEALSLTWKHIVPAL